MALAALCGPLMLLTACSSADTDVAVQADSTTVEVVDTAAATSDSTPTDTEAPSDTTATDDTTVAATDTATTTVDAGPGGAGGAGGGGFGGQCTASGVTPTAAVPANAVPKTADPTAVAAGVTAAQAFLATLSTEQKTATMFGYADLDAKRCSWSNFPSGIFDGRQGVRIGDLTDAQRTAALAAVQSLMSAAGYTYVQGAIAGDQYLAEQGESNMGSDNYYLAFYGDPAATTPWTLQFGAHHLAIHISVGGEALSVSPYFQGLQPLSFQVDGKTIEAMSVDANHMFGLFEAMDETQLALAKLSGTYDDLVMGPGADTGYPTAEGIAYTDLTAAQQELVKAAIADWVTDAAPELSAPFIDLYYSQLNDTKVSWSMSTSRDAGAYMRIDGPRVWIEWVNTTAGGGLHYHTVYRDKLVDYGTGTTG